MTKIETCGNGTEVQGLEMQRNCVRLRMIKINLPKTTKLRTIKFLLRKKNHQFESKTSLTTYNLQNSTKRYNMYVLFNIHSAFIYRWLIAFKTNQRTGKSAEIYVTSSLCCLRQVRIPVDIIPKKAVVHLYNFLIKHKVQHWFSTSYT